MDGEGVMKTQDSCYGGASVAGAVIGTFLTTILLLVVAALVYRQWRRHKGKHLVLVTNPEIVEDAYAFDNPCFKDATPALNRNHDGGGPLSTTSLVVESTPTNGKDSARWSSPWSSLVFTGATINKNDRRRTLDDSCLGTKATRISVVSLRSRDFTGLGFNVCGNMREGIFVKDLLHRGPASESGRIHPGDRIASVKISFRSMVYEDALTILSYASPYDVELEVESGGVGGSGGGSRPTTLLKKTVGPSTSRICHPLYRSQSIPELSQAQKTSSKRLFIADPSNESLGSNYSTMNSTIKSSKSTPGNHSLERRHEDAKAPNNHHHQHNHHKFGIKVLPALDGTVHRVENQNEHNTNLERRNSRRLDIETSEDPVTRSNATRKIPKEGDNDEIRRNVEIERYQKRESAVTSGTTDPTIVNSTATIDDRANPKTIAKGNDVTDLAAGSKIGIVESPDTVIIPSEVPPEVHNAAMAARRNRKNSMELLNNARLTNVDSAEASNDLKSPQKNKRKAPPPPINPANEEDVGEHADNHDRDTDHDRVSSSPKRNNRDRGITHDGIESITDYVDSLNDYVGKVRESVTIDHHETIVERVAADEKKSTDSKRRGNKSEDDSDNDSEIHDSFTTIELKPADITIHHTPVPSASRHRVQSNGHRNLDDIDVNDVGENGDGSTEDVYRKAASLGDLSKYENKSLATLERAQSLDMADTGTKKRNNKHGVLASNDDANESTEDLTRIIEDAETFDRRKLKKSNEWGTLEDAIWKRPDPTNKDAISSSARLNGNLERSRSAIESRNDDNSKDNSRRGINDDEDETTSLELYNLPLSIGLTREFVRTERMFDPDGDNSLARIVNNGRIVKSPTPSEIELDFRKAMPEIPEIERDPTEIEEFEVRKSERIGDLATSPNDDEFRMAIRYFDRETSRSSINDENAPNPFDIDLSSVAAENNQSGKAQRDAYDSRENSLYAGKSEVHEVPIRRTVVAKGCPGCDRKYSHHEHECATKSRGQKNRDTEIHDTIDWKPQEVSKLSPESAADQREPNPLSAFQIGLTRFERSYYSSEPRSERKSMTERDVEPHLLDNDDPLETDPIVDEDDEAVYEFGSSITVNSKCVISPQMDRRNVSNVSVSSGENSEDSGLVPESGDYTRQDSSEQIRPPLPDTPAPVIVKDSPPQKLTYITEINLSSPGNTVNEDSDAKSSRNSIAPTSNGKTTGTKKPPVPPRRNDASKTLQSREHESTTGNDKRLVYVSEYRTSGSANKDKNENDEKTIGSSIADTCNEAARAHGDKKFENWIYVGDNIGERNPWGNGSSNSQQQPVTNIVVSGATDDKNKIARQ